MDNIEIIAYSSIFGSFICFLIALFFEGKDGMISNFSNINITGADLSCGYF